jgi:hypothetical protein
MVRVFSRLSSVVPNKKNTRPRDQYAQFWRSTIGAQLTQVMYRTCSDIEVLNVKVTLFILLLFASLPDCGQNQTAVSDEQYAI